MVAIFLKMLNMNLAASWLILIVIFLRVCLRRAPKWISGLLWAAVAVRLICPFSVESVFSLIPSAAVFSAYNVQYETPRVQTGADVFDRAVNPVLENHFTPNIGDSVNPFYVWIWIAAVIWLIGMAAMFLYAVYTILRVYGTVREKVPVREGFAESLPIYLCDQVKSPFILGIFAPKIFLPSGIDPDLMSAVIAHEKAHISRRDYLWKPLGFLILMVYWFNPLCWAAYILLCRDIEFACDERVIRRMDFEERKAYSSALVDCSGQRRLVTVCPLAFGEVGVKERVKSILRYKKPAFWMIAAALMVCAAVGVCFLTDPVSEAGTGKREKAWMKRTLEEISGNYTLEEAKKDGCLVMENGSVTSGQESFERFLARTKKKKPAMLRMVQYYELGDPSGYSPEHYEEIKDTYPRLFVQDIFYEHGKYRVLLYEDGKPLAKEFAYMVEDHFEANSPDAIFSAVDVWFLCDREDVTYHEVMRSIASSQFGDLIPSHVVYEKKKYK